MRSPAPCVFEQRILVCAVKGDATNDQRSRLQELLSKIGASDRLIDAAVREGVAGLLYKCLLKLDLLAALGTDARDRLRAVYYRTVSVNLKLLHEVKCVLGALQEDGVPVVLLQGAALLTQVYADPGLRPMRDVDVWVLPKHYSQLVSRLERLGFERHPIYPNIFRRGSTLVDVHSHILWADRIKARGRLLEVPQEDIFRRAQPGKLDGVDTLCLSAADQVIYLSMHAVKHNYQRLIWLADVLQCLSSWSPDPWRVLLNRAEELGQSHTLSGTLYLLVLLFDIEIPQTFQLLQPHALEKAILRKRLTGGKITNWGRMLLLCRGKPLGTRAALVFESLFPRPEVLRQVFADTPDVKPWQMYVKRMGQIVRVVGTGD